MSKEQFWAQGAFLNILKPCGMTSHDVVDAIRRGWKRSAPFELPGGAREPKVGHLGTLDPDASGVLPLALGRATKLIPILPAADKVYTAEITLGLTSHTCDIGGIVEPGQPFVGDAQQVMAALAGFQGSIMQRPPQVSALKQGGKRGYERARQGEVFELPARPTVYHRATLEGTLWRWPLKERFGYLLAQPHNSNLDGNCLCTSFRLTVHCGPGTYIRALARDLGEALGCGGLLTGLVRTASGPFLISNSHTLEELPNWPLVGVDSIKEVLA